jgi:hypothetical protein
MHQVRSYFELSHQVKQDYLSGRKPCTRYNIKDGVMNYVREIRNEPESSGGGAIGYHNDPLSWIQRIDLDSEEYITGDIGRCSMCMSNKVSCMLSASRNYGSKHYSIRGWVSFSTGYATRSH